MQKFEELPASVGDAVPLPLADGRRLNPAEAGDRGRSTERFDDAFSLGCDCFGFHTENYRFTYRAWSIGSPIGSPYRLA